MSAGWLIRHFWEVMDGQEQKFHSTFRRDSRGQEAAQGKPQCQHSHPTVVGKRPQRKEDSREAGFDDNPAIERKCGSPAVLAQRDEEDRAGDTRRGFATVSFCGSIINFDQTG